MSAPKTQSDKFLYIHREISEHEWPGQIKLIVASPVRIEMNY
jgi:hypothetical protein